MIVMYRIAQQDIITTSQAEAIDHLFRDRWRALLSVDDAVVGVMDALEELQVLENTCAPQMKTSRRHICSLALEIRSALQLSFGSGLLLLVHRHVFHIGPRL